MGSSRLLASLGAQAGVVAACAASLLALHGGLYASALVAALAGAWLAATQVSAATRTALRLPAPASIPRGDETLLLQALLEATPMPLVLMTPDRRVRAVNRAARTLFRTDGTFSPPSALAHTLREGAVGDRRSLRLGEGAAARPYAATLADVAVKGAALRLAALTDVQAEARAAEADALQQLVQVLGHELMNSLTPIASLADTAAGLLAAPGPAPDQVQDARDALRTIQRRAEGLHEFVESYRSLGRLPAPRLRAVDVRLLVDDAVRMSEADGVGRPRVTVEGPPSPTIWRTDPDLVGQALANLLLNAAQAARSAPEPQIRVALSCAADTLQISVSDNGPGVPPAEAEAVFLPFVSSRPGGSGIGLHLARSAVRSLGGDLVLETSAVGRLNQFSLRI